jgi:hypothetical protein
MEVGPPEDLEVETKLLIEINERNGRLAGIPGRHVDEGILMIPEKVSFLVLQFQGFPSWILALDWTVVQHVTFVDWESPGALLHAMQSQCYNLQY